MVYPLTLQRATELEQSILYFKASALCHYHSTILNEGFRITLVDSDRYLDFATYFEHYCQIFNLIKGQLIVIGILDNYGRLKLPIDKATLLLESKYGEKKDEEESFHSFLIRIFLTKGGINFPEYLDIYPQCLIKVPFLAISKAILGLCRIPTIDPKMDHYEIEFPMALFKEDDPGVNILYDVRKDRAVFEAKMKNQYGNQVCLSITSNTNMTDSFFYYLFEEDIILDSMVIMVGFDQELAPVNKLLLTVSYENKKGKELMTP